MKPSFHRSLVLGLGSLVVAAGMLLPVRSAHAIPAFARKYGTSCTTCHTVYPKLNPFGEAFRRNGYRFPGKDSDVVKEDPVSLGRDAYKKVFPDAVWPGSLPGSVPLAFGVNGQIDFHPKKDSGAGNAADNSLVDVTHLVDEAHRAALSVFCWTLRAENAFLPAHLRLGEAPEAHGAALGEARLLLSRGVDGLITDAPDHAVRAVSELVDV